MKRLASALLACLVCAGCATSERFYYAAPTSLPGVAPEMKRPGFWIARHPSPDKVVMNPHEIDEFNLSLIEPLKLVKDVTKFPVSISGNEFKTSQLEILKDLKAQGLYRADRARAGDSFYSSIKQNMNLKTVPVEIRAQFGFIANFADQRILPTDEGLYGKPNDIDFDELQNSGLDIGTPVVVLHRSLDNKWLYAQSSLSAGWVEADKVAFCESKELDAFMSGHKPVVVIDSKADIYLDPGLKEYYGYVRMGATLAFSGNTDSRLVEVVVPLRENSGAVSFRKCYMRKESVREGYVPYTARNMIQQAFELLNEPYGWGDMRGEQDCSRFIQQIFATAGIQLPRNSADQGKAGSSIAEFDKTAGGEERIKILETKAIGGLTILYLKGHIMLFLGMADDAPYVIHATWAYRENIEGRDTVRLINRVAVTDLSLGKGSGKGSLLERLVKVKLISK